MVAVRATLAGFPALTSASYLDERLGLAIGSGSKRIADRAGMERVRRGGARPPWMERCPRRPCSRPACRTHWRQVSPEPPILAAIDRIASYCKGHSPPSINKHPAPFARGPPVNLRGCFLRLGSTPSRVGALPRKPRGGSAAMTPSGTRSIPGREKFWDGKKFRVGRRAI